MTDVLIRFDGGPLDLAEYHLEGPIPPATIDVHDLTGSVHYLRTWTRWNEQDDAWRYVSGHPDHPVRSQHGGGYRQ